MATGVLPLLIGRATRLAQFFSTGEKKYDARIRFGWGTDTYDRDGKPISEPVTPQFTRDELEAALAPCRGTFLQTPPPFSAKKIAGTPAYRWRARTSPWNCSLWKFTCSHRSCWNSRARRRRSACIARPERICEASRTKRGKTISREGDLIAIGEARLPHLYHPILVL